MVNEAEARLEAAEKVLHRWGPDPLDGTIVVFKAALTELEAAASTVAQMRVEALEAALEDALMGLAIFGDDHRPHEEGEVTRVIERGRAVLTATEQEPEPEEQA